MKNPGLKDKQTPPRQVEMVPRARLTRERCGGDRHASAWEMVPECTVKQYGKSVSFAAHVYNIDTGAMHDVPEV